VERIHAKPENKTSIAPMNRFEIAYELYDDQKIRLFACPQVMK
jgi:hypothetical protein